MDLQTGKKQRLLPDFVLEHYDVSPDGKQVIFITADGTGHAPLWIATTDGSSPPRRLLDLDCVRALFAPNGEIYFAGGERGKIYLQKIRADGTGLNKIIPDPPVFLYDISPDGNWLAAWVGTDVMIYPSGVGTPKLLCPDCGGAGAEERGVTPPAVSWSRDGKELYLYSSRTQQTYTVPLRPGQVLPALPASGISWSNGPPPVAGARLIPQPRAFMSGNRTVYAYLRLATHRNIYRILVP
jgi:WD40 repeat protein